MPILDVELIGAPGENLAQRLAEVTGRPAEHIHILFESAARDRIAFGGEQSE